MPRIITARQQAELIIGKKKKKLKPPPQLDKNRGRPPYPPMASDGVADTNHDIFRRNDPNQLYPLLRNDNTFAQQFRRYLETRGVNIDPDEDDEFYDLVRQAALELPDHVLHTARVDAAEQVMTNTGLNGRTFHVPRASVAEAQGLGIEPWQLQRRHSAEAEHFVNGILKGWGWQPASEGHRISVQPFAWRLRNADHTMAYTDGINTIGLAGEHTDELTLLHETAHILAGTPEHGSSHGPEFQNILHVLYHEHLGPEAANTFGNIVLPDHHTAATKKSPEQHLRDTYEPYPPGSPDLPDSLRPHLMLPTEIAHHYREYDRPDDENTQMLKRVIADQGIRQPLKISTDGTHALLIEGNHRLNVARQLGMSHVPVQVFMEKPGEVMTNESYSRPVPLEPHLGNWVNENRQYLKSFWS